MNPAINFLTKNKPFSISIAGIILLCISISYIPKIAELHALGYDLKDLRISYILGLFDISIFLLLSTPILLMAIFSKFIKPIADYIEDSDEEKDFLKIEDKISPKIASKEDKFRDYMKKHKSFTLPATYIVIIMIILAVNIYQIVTFRTELKSILYLTEENYLWIENIDVVAYISYLFPALLLIGMAIFTFKKKFSEFFIGIIACSIIFSLLPHIYSKQFMDSFKKFHNRKDGSDIVYNHIFCFNKKWSKMGLYVQNRR